MKAHARFFFLILICLLTVFSVGIASAEADGAKPFSTDYEAINEAAQSMFLVEIYGANDTLLGTGSGFIAFDEHYFVTNHHVIEDAKYLVVVDDNGKEYKVTDLLVADEEKDIAILSFEEAANYRPLPLCADENLLRGQPIVAIGSPKGVRNTVTTGNISNLIDDNGTHIIQFTAAASPGSSGGAIFNDRGEVIGLMFSKHTDAENMNYAIGIDEVLYLNNKSISHSISLSDYNHVKDFFLIIPTNSKANWRKNTNGIVTKVSIQIENISKVQRIDSYKLRLIWQTSSGKIYQTKEFKHYIVPEGKTVYSGNFDAVNTIGFSVGIKEVTFINGETITYDESQIEYHYYSK